MNDDLAFLSIADAALRIRAGALSPVALVDAALDRVARIEPAVHAYISIDADHGRAAAKAAAAEIAAGTYRGPLHGIPYGLKDVIHVAGRVTSANSRVALDRVACVDADVYRRLRAAGAILIGKLNTYEFGTGTGADLFQLPFPPARNPWNTRCFTGGSSTGAGAAVAAGLATFAIGIDTGGSVRLPAAACGVTGLKPTYELVSRDGIMPNCPSLDHVGPLARSAEDAALVLSAIAEWPMPALQRIDALKVGVVRRWHEQDVAADPAVGPAFDSALGVFTGLGAHIIELKCPLGQRQFVDCMRLINNPECFAVHREDFLAHRDKMGPALFAKFMSGLSVSAEAQSLAVHWRKYLVACVEDLFGACDVIVCPTTARPPPPLDDGAAVADYTTIAATMPFSLSGHPALSIPMGFSPDRLPLGLQIAARRGRDDLVLCVGHAFQQATDWHRRRSPCVERPVGAYIKPAASPSTLLDRARARALLATAGVSAPSERDLEICATQAGRMDTLVAHMRETLP